ncbi:MAG: L-aspartate oxidase [Bacteroidales bacterium]|nr:L-aspartate oxidase [Bacteroidales bacterium]
MNLKRRQTDFLVLGSGLAGLVYALNVSKYGKVILATKTTLDETATSYAQGGIAAVTYLPDSYEKHIQDTLKAGCYLNDEHVVRTIIGESGGQIKELIRWGVRFDKNSAGRFDLSREGGHSEKRVLHWKDKTGFEIQRALTEKVKNNKNISILENHFAIDIITQHHLGEYVTRKTKDICCYGAYIYDNKTGNIITILSKVTLVATGGSGNVYSNTTNPPLATGDGISMVYRANGEVKDMEFVQFHPTALYYPSEKPSFLITEAMRGFGAVLKDVHNNEFMYKYDERGALAPRDIVARAIDNEMKQSGHSHVYLDSTHLNKNELILHFPYIYAKCLSVGIDITKDKIPIVPAAHYLCGGIKIDIDGQSSIKNLFAAGECACSGMHGANRLASNSLLEAIVISHRAAKKSSLIFKDIVLKNDVPDWNAEGTLLNEEMVLVTQSVHEVQEIMSNYVGIVRTNLRLKRALDRLEILYKETEELYNKSVVTQKICELRNIINIAYLIIKFASQRKESIGLHYNIDYHK